MILHIHTEHKRNASCPSDRDINEAVKRYDEFIASGGVVPKRGRQDAQHRGYLLPSHTIQQIKDLADKETPKMSQGGVIAKHIGRAWKKAFPSRAV